VFESGYERNALEFIDPLLSRIPRGFGAENSGPIDRLYSVIGDTDSRLDEKRRDCNFLFANGRRLAGRTSWEELCDDLKRTSKFLLLPEAAIPCSYMRGL